MSVGSRNRGRSRRPGSTGDPWTRWRSRPNAAEAASRQSLDAHRAPAIEQPFDSSTSSRAPPRTPASRQRPRRPRQRHQVITAQGLSSAFTRTQRPASGALASTRHTRSRLGLEPGVTSPPDRSHFVAPSCPAGTASSRTNQGRRHETEFNPALGAASENAVSAELIPRPAPTTCSTSPSPARKEGRASERRGHSSHTGNSPRGGRSAPVEAIGGSRR